MATLRSFAWNELVETNSTEEKTKKVEPKAPSPFKSIEELVIAFWGYADECVNSDNGKIPTRTGFCRWYVKKTGLKVSPSTVYAALKRKFPQEHDEIKEVLQDAICEGAASGKYRAGIAIFTLQNVYGWTDNSRVKEDSDKELTIKLIRDSRGIESGTKTRAIPLPAESANSEKAVEKVIGAADVKEENDGS